MTKDEEKLEELREAVHAPGATDKDREAFKRQSQKVAEARQAERIAEEKAGRRLGPHTPADKVSQWEAAGVASPQTVAANTGVNETGGGS